MPGPLTGVRIIDLSRVLAGPWATQSLADLGAEVIKIERPGTGDDTRSFAPFVADGASAGESIYFLSTNRGKKSVTIDLAQREGQELVRRLSEWADVLVENYKVGNLAKFKLDYESLSARNPRLIYCSITGFGQTGPNSLRAGYDLVIQAMGGLMSITGEAEKEPMKSGVAMADILTGLYATQAILAALYERTTSGRGQYIDLAMLDVQIATLANLGAEYLMTGAVPKRHGNAHGSIVPTRRLKPRMGGSLLRWRTTRSLRGLRRLWERRNWRRTCGMRRMRIAFGTECRCWRSFRSGFARVRRLRGLRS